MPDITVIPPTKFLSDVSLPFVDESLQEEYLQSIANPLIVTTIQALFPGTPVSIALDEVLM